MEAVCSVDRGRIKNTEDRSQGPPVSPSSSSSSSSSSTPGRLRCSMDGFACSLRPVLDRNVETGRYELWALRCLICCLPTQARAQATEIHKAFSRLRWLTADPGARDRPPYHHVSTRGRVSPMAPCSRWHSGPARTQSFDPCTDMTTHGTASARPSLNRVQVSDSRSFLSARVPGSGSVLFCHLSAFFRYDSTGSFIGSSHDQPSPGTVPASPPPPPPPPLVRQ